MCNLSGYIYEEGIEEGRVQGRAKDILRVAQRAVRKPKRAS